MLTVNVYSEAQACKDSAAFGARAQPRQRQRTEGGEAAGEEKRDSTVTGR